MDELANNLLNRINGLARKGLDENLSDAQRQICFIRIGECVKLIKKVEKLDSGSDDVDDDDVATTPPAPRQRRTSSSTNVKAAV